MAFTDRRAGVPGARGRLGLLSAAALAAAACGKAAPAALPEADPARLLVGIVATCAGAVKEVEVRRAGERGWEPAAAGAVFRAGDEVRTGPRSSARIAFLGGGGLELEASAAVVVDVARQDGAARPGGDGPAPAPAAGEGRVRVVQGVVRGVLPARDGRGDAAGLVVASADGSQLRVASRAGEEPATVRLTRWERGTELAVLRGTASVEGAGGARTLGAGRVAFARGGELVDSAELVPPPQAAEPGADARFHLVPGLAVPLRWKPVRGATGYRIQVARDPSFREVEVAETVDGTGYVFRPAGAGVHAWRVAARDGAGREGEYGPPRRLHCEEQPPRDLLVGPADAAVVSAEGSADVTFSWEAAGAAGPYRLVVARGPDLLAQGVTRLVVPGQRATVRIAGPGEYWWGVYAGDEDAPRPLFTRPRRLSLAGAPRPAPKPRISVPDAISQWGT